ncbi:MAG TPA: GtrA family protein [Candidatus Woesebacteria bacterium]|nr:GtrA family protein [Candidatus Woesebacteria bacterium]
MDQKKSIIQFIKFGLVGVSNTLVDWLVFYLLKAIFNVAREGEPIIKAIAFLVAMLNSYYWNTVWTFKDEYKGAVAKEENAKGQIFIKFVVVSLIGWVINYYSFDYTRLTLGQSSIVSLIVASAAATLWNFFANKLWTYKAANGRQTIPNNRQRIEQS